MDRDLNVSQEAWTSFLWRQNGVAEDAVFCYFTQPQSDQLLQKSQHSNGNPLLKEMVKSSRPESASLRLGSPIGSCLDASPFLPVIPQFKSLSFSTLPEAMTLVTITAPVGDPSSRLRILPCVTVIAITRLRVGRDSGSLFCACSCRFWIYMHRLFVCIFAVMTPVTGHSSEKTKQPWQTKDMIIT